jgi:hypothetical protein
MIKIPCEVCKVVFDSTLELKIHRLENHYQYYFELVNGDEVLLLRCMGVLK